MKLRLALASCTLAASLFSLPAVAQPVPAATSNATTPVAGNQNVTPGMGQRSGSGKQKRDCSQSPNPDSCKARQEARKKAMEECQGKTGAERKQCVHDKMPPPDCSKSANPERCNNMLKAHEACKDKSSQERRQCMQEQFKTK